MTTPNVLPSHVLHAYRAISNHDALGADQRENGVPVTGMRRAFLWSNIQGRGWPTSWLVPANLLATPEEERAPFVADCAARRRRLNASNDWRLRMLTMPQHKTNTHNEYIGMRVAAEFKKSISAINLTSVIKPDKTDTYTRTAALTSALATRDRILGVQRQMFSSIAPLLILAATAVAGQAPGGTRPDLVVINGATPSSLLCLQIAEGL